MSFSMFCGCGVIKGQGCRGADRLEEADNTPVVILRIENGFESTGKQKQKGSGCFIFALRLQCRLQLPSEP